MIVQLTPADIFGIFFGCGSNDPLLYYPGNIRIKSNLESQNLPEGGHGMPVGFMERGLIFLDSMIAHPSIYIRHL